MISIPAWQQLKFESIVAEVHFETIIANHSCCPSLPTLISPFVGLGFCVTSPPPLDQKDAMAEKLRRKAELQKQASKSMNFADSLKREQEFKNKQKQQTKEERRNALCEELGRGC